MKLLSHVLPALAGLFSVALAACGPDETSGSAPAPPAGGVERPGPRAVASGDPVDAVLVLDEVSVSRRVDRLVRGAQVRSEVVHNALTLFVTGRAEAAASLLYDAPIPPQERDFWLARIGLGAEYFGQGPEWHNTRLLERAARGGHEIAAYELALAALTLPDRPIDPGEVLEIVDSEQFDDSVRIGAARFILRLDDPEREQRLEEVLSAAAEGELAARVEAALSLLEADPSSQEATRQLLSLGEAITDAPIAAYYAAIALHERGESEAANALFAAASEGGIFQASAHLAFEMINRLRLVSQFDRDEAYLAELREALTLLAKAEAGEMAMASFAAANTRAEIARITGENVRNVRERLEVAHLAGFGAASYDLAVTYIYGLDGPADPDRGWGMIRRQAELGHPDAASIIASRELARGLQAEMTLDEIAGYLRFAAERARPEAAFNLAAMMEGGLVAQSDSGELQALRVRLEELAFLPDPGQLREVQIEGRQVTILADLEPRLGELYYFSLGESVHAPPSALLRLSPFEGSSPLFLGYVSLAGGRIEEARDLHFALDEGNPGQPLTGIVVVRNAETGEVVWTDPVEDGEASMMGCRSISEPEGCGYPVVATIPPRTLSPGVYYAYMVNQGGERSNSVFLTYYDDRRADVALIYPDYTWHAYMVVNGVSYYTSNPSLLYTLSMHRPLQTNTFKDHHSATGTIEFIRPLEAEGLSVRHLTNHDLHTDPTALDGVRLVVLTTHDEYWTHPIRDRLEAFVADGGALISASGNVGWWLHAVDGPVMFQDKNPPDPDYERVRGTGRNDYPGVDRPIEAFLGSSFLYGGYPPPVYLSPEAAMTRFAYDRDTLFDLRTLYVDEPGHPIFDGVDLGPKGEFGGEELILDVELDAMRFRLDGAPDTALAPAVNRTARGLATAQTYNGNAVNHVNLGGRFEFNSVIVESEFGDGRILALGSVGWFNSVGIEGSDANRIFRNSVNYLIER